MIETQGRHDSFATPAMSHYANAILCLQPEFGLQNCDMFKENPSPTGRCHSGTAMDTRSNKAVLCPVFQEVLIAHVTCHGPAIAVDNNKHRIAALGSANLSGGCSARRISWK